MRSRTRWRSSTSRQRKAVAIALDLRSQDSIKAAFERATKSSATSTCWSTTPAARCSSRWSTSPTPNGTTSSTPTSRARSFCRNCSAAPASPQARPGVIVSMASTHGMTGIAGRSVYGISKAGLIQMTRMLAIEWADKNIRVNAIAPTTVMTESRAAAAERSRQAGGGAVAHSVRPFRHAGGNRRRGGLSREPRRRLGDRPTLPVDGGLTAI